MQADPNPEVLKQTVKAAFVELLHKERDALRQVLAEAMEDIAFAEAIREGRQSELIDREAVFDMLEST